MRSLTRPRRALSLAIVFSLWLSAGESRAIAKDEGETSDATTTVKKSYAESLPGKWRAKLEVDEERLKKAGVAAGADFIPGMTGLVLEFKADGAYSVTMENVGGVAGEQTLDGTWKVVEEGVKNLALEFDEKPQRNELKFETADRFTLHRDDLGPLKPPVFNRVKKEEEEADKRKPEASAKSPL